MNNVKAQSLTELFHTQPLFDALAQGDSDRTLNCLSLYNDGAI